MVQRLAPHLAGLVGIDPESLELGRESGSYAYGDALADLDTSFLNFNYLESSGACVVGDPATCVETAKRYEAAGCDLLLCLVNPYDIPHDQVMQSIELFGKHVIPEFDKERATTAV